ncbi:NADP-dependent oxidoreductase domain-containing protein [Umbelopsis sp. PMI_123]|nr:NADP-dependent oxidoreductase domain-containing protein [Umbelopsis sp. PMI_123]
MALGRTAKLNTGAQIPLVGLGTWLAKENEVKNATEHAINYGYRHIDCAHVYRNEHEVGQALKNVKVPREQIFITSKVWNNSHRPDRVEKALDVTLKNLGVSYLDLYLIHWPVAFKPTEDLFPTTADGKVALDDGVTIADTWAAMEKLLDTGKVKAIGVSNFNIEKLEKLKTTAKIIPAVNQVELHPYLPQDDLLEYSQKNGIHLTAYSPLGNNLAGAARVVDDPTVVKVAEKLGKTPAQVLISWAAQRGTSVIPKSVTPSRIESNFHDFELPKEDFEALKQLGAKNIRYNVPSTYSPAWPVDVFGDGR